MRTIVLPRLAGTRELARSLVLEAASDSGEVSSAILSARAVDVAAPSFLDELVKELKESGAEKIIVQGASEELFRKMQEKAVVHGGIAMEKKAA